MRSLEVSGVSVCFGETVALHSVDLSASSGEVLGIAGANGAGKTTLLSLLGGRLQETDGVVEFDGVPRTRRQRLAMTGMVPDPPLIPPAIRGAEWLRYLADWRCRDPSTATSRVRDVIEFVDASSFVARRVRAYSRGMAQRLGLAGALICANGLLLMDETLSGIDPLVRRRLVNALQGLASQGWILVVASHDLGLLEQVANRLIVLDKGTVRLDQPMSSALGARILHVAVRGANPRGIKFLLRRFPGSLEASDGVEVPIAGELTADRVLAVCHAERIPVVASTVRSARLDDVVCKSIEEETDVRA